MDNLYLNPAIQDPILIRIRIVKDGFLISLLDVYQYPTHIRHILDYPYPKKSEKKNRFRRYLFVYGPFSSLSIVELHPSTWLVPILGVNRIHLMLILGISLHAILWVSPSNSPRANFQCQQNPYMIVILYIVLYIIKITRNFIVHI